MSRYFKCVIPTYLLSLRLDQMSKEAETNTRDIIIGQRLGLQSHVLGEERPYWVFLPISYSDGTYAPQRYPVLYLLDGEEHFHSASGLVRHMSSVIQIPELIVVAIPNTSRIRDLTRTHSKFVVGKKESDALGSSGGGETFLRFLEEELSPHIDSTYRTLPYRVLVGHSLGGLLVLHTLLDVPDMYQSYIAIDPSLWWDNEVLNRKVESRIKDAKDVRADFGENYQLFRTKVTTHRSAATLAVLMIGKW